MYILYNYIGVIQVSVCVYMLQYQMVDVHLISAVHQCDRQTNKTRIMNSGRVGTVTINVIGSLNDVFTSRCFRPLSNQLLFVRHTDNIFLIPNCLELIFVVYFDCLHTMNEDWVGCSLLCFFLVETVQGFHELCLLSYELINFMLVTV